MHRIKQIAIVFTDTLRGIGLQSLLTDYFPPVEVSHFPTLEQLSMAGNELYDYYFTDPETFVMNPDFFLPRRNKTAILSESTLEPNGSAVVNRITTGAPQELILEQLQFLFAEEHASAYPAADNNKGLSGREIDVLRLIAKGVTNKEIADKLSISLNTVLTHRKNITAKLGIKTVSGLTFYAIMNGIVSGEEIGL